MFGLGVPELIVIFVIALLVFGPKKLPDIGRSLGKAMAEFKKTTHEFKESMDTEMRDVKDAADVGKLVNLQTDSTYPDSPEQGDETGMEGEKTPAENTKKKEGHEHGNGNAEDGQR